MKSAVLEEPILVGRDAEFKQLQNHLSLAFEGKGSTVFISGEAGAGKTRLVNEFLDSAKEKGAKIIAGWCMSKAGMPYFPFVEAFSAYLSSAHDGKSKTIVAEQLGITGWLKGGEFSTAEQLGIKGWLKGPKHDRKFKAPEIPSPEILKDITFSAVTKALFSISNEEPTILLIEDLHWADSASISLLHYVSRSIVSSKVLLIATFRREELPSDSEGHPHPLIETMRLMSREDLYDEVKLSDLHRQDIAKLAESMMGGDIDHELIDRLTEESQGNPLFTVESLRMLHDCGGLIRKNGKWRLSADEVGIPNKVKDIILRRLGVLNNTQKRILELASIIGERFDPAIIAAVLSIDKIQVLENLSSITQCAFLVNPEDSVYSFGHARFREVLYEELATPLKREYHARVADLIEKLCQAVNEKPVNDLAFHYIHAGNREKAITYSVAAGENSIKRFSNAEAAKNFSYVLKAVAEDPRYKNERMIASEGLGDAYSAMGAFEEAIIAFENLSNISESGEVRLRALRKAMIASFNRGDFPHALELADKAEKDSGFDALEYARVRMCRAKTNAFRANTPYVDTLRELTSCLRIFEERNTLTDVADALQEIGGLHVTQCQSDEALQVLKRAIELHQQLGDSRKQADAYFWEGNVYFSKGLLQEALLDFEKVIQIDERIGEYNRMAWAELYSGLLHESIGEIPEALQNSLKALEYAEKTDSYYIQSMACANITRAYAKLEDWQHMDEYRKKFRELFADASRTSSKLAHAVGIRTEAVAYAAKCQWQEANKHFEECLTLYKGAMLTAVHEAMARTDYASALIKQGKTDYAKTQLHEALQLCSKIDNKTQIKRLNALLAEVKST